jgi:hypothetical protein
MPKATAKAPSVALSSAFFIVSEAPKPAQFLSRDERRSSSPELRPRPIRPIRRRDSARKRAKIAAELRIFRRKSPNSGARNTGNPPPRKVDTPSGRIGPCAENRAKTA